MTGLLEQLAEKVQAIDMVVRTEVQSDALLVYFEGERYPKSFDLETTERIGLELATESVAAFAKMQRLVKAWRADNPTG